MSQLLSYLCTDDNLTRVVVNMVRREAWHQPPQPWAASGFGWVQDSRTLLRKQPRLSAPVDMLGLMADVPARALVGQMSADTNGAVDSLDLQPFRFRKWVYAQTGHAPYFEAYRERLLEQTPDHLRRAVRGQSDAEVLFLRFYHHMCEHKALGPGPADPPRVAHALTAMIDEVQEFARSAGHEGRLGLNMVAATERMMIAACTGEPLHLRIFHGLEEPGEDPLFAGHRTRAIQHPQFRAAFIASALTPQGEHWQQIDADTVVWVDQRWTPETSSLRG